MLAMQVLCKIKPFFVTIISQSEELKKTQGDSCGDLDSLPCMQVEFEDGVNRKNKNQYFT